MNTITKRTFVVALGGMLLAGLSFVGGADAAIRDAGAKARGEYGVGFWNSNSQVRRSYSYRPSYRTNRRYRSTPSYSAPKKAPWQYPKSDPRRFRS